MRGVCLVLLAGALACAAGCASTPRPLAHPSRGVDSAVRKLETQVSRSQTLLDAATGLPDPEPAHDVSNGFFIGLVSQVSTDSAGEWATVDFATLGGPPHTDVHVWNRVRHPQRLRLAPDALAALPGGGSAEYAVLSGPELASAWRTQPDFTSTAFYFAISDGRVNALWPVELP